MNHKTFFPSLFQKFTKNQYFSRSWMLPIFPSKNLKLFSLCFFLTNLLLVIKIHSTKRNKSLRLTNTLQSISTKLHSSISQALSQTPSPIKSSAHFGGHAKKKKTSFKQFFHLHGSKYPYVLMPQGKQIQVRPSSHRCV